MFEWLSIIASTLNTTITIYGFTFTWWQIIVFDVFAGLVGYVIFKIFD